jgi:hypothetical protein
MIAYDSTRDTGGTQAQIYTMKPDGRVPTLITNDTTGCCSTQRQPGRGQNVNRFRYCGPRSIRAACSKCGDQGCAELVHTSTAGSSHDASSSDPTLMKASSGATAAMLKTGEPHAEQKFRCVSRPWSSPVVANEASVLPSTLNAARGTPTITENGLPVWRWQSAQWQTA